jgi:hypothetical protein
MAMDFLSTECKSPVPFAELYGLDDQGSIPSRDNGGIFFFLQPYPDQLWSPLSLLSNEYQGLLPQG